MTELTKSVIKNFAKGKGIENDKLIDGLADVIGSIVNKETPPNSDKYEDKIDSDSSSDNDENSSPQDMGKLINGLMGSFAGKSSFDRVDKPIATQHNTFESKISTVRSKYAFQLVNNLYNEFWSSPTLSKLEQYYHQDAIIDVYSNDTNINFSIEGNNKIVNFFKTLWLPITKNTNTIILDFHFRVSDLDHFTCTVTYDILQKSLDMGTMMWTTYNIQATDVLVLANRSGVLAIQSHHKKYSRYTTDSEDEKY